MPPRKKQSSPSANAEAAAKTEREALDVLRVEIDEIDDAIHDLIMRRTNVVEKVRDVKEGQPVKIRPSREARILYRLMKRHKGPFPRRELVRIWRELIVATLGFEGPFSVAVHDPEKGGPAWEMARTQYGSFTDMTGHSSVRRVIEAVRSGDAIVGILPFPREEEADPWWRHLVTEKADAPRIIARLPFGGVAKGQARNFEALAICCIGQDATGRDRSWLAVDADASVSKVRMRAAAKTAKLPMVFMDSWHDDQKPEMWLHAVEINEFIAADDPRIAAFAEAIGEEVKRVVRLGGYAIPLTAEELGAAPKSARKTVRKS